LARRVTIPPFAAAQARDWHTPSVARRGALAPVANDALGYSFVVDIVWLWPQELS
jgi:hypothetical protein